MAQKMEILERVENVIFNLPTHLVHVQVAKNTLQGIDNSVKVS